MKTLATAPALQAGSAPAAGGARRLASRAAARATPLPSPAGRQSRATATRNTTVRRRAQ